MGDNMGGNNMIPHFYVLMARIDETSHQMQCSRFGSCQILLLTYRRMCSQ